MKPNRRAIAFACVPPIVLGGLGLWMIVGPWRSEPTWWRGVGIGLLLAAAALLAMLLRQLRRPRIAYRDGHVLFYLRSGPPVPVPAEYVEAFFLGQGPASLPGSTGTESVNLIARLSQRQTEWAQLAVKPALGRWCGGYVTIRGTWCEPLGTAVIRRLNRRLKEVSTPGHAERPQ